MLENNLKRFRLIAFVEGISFLVLLFIAMPIKYLLGEPLMVKFVGMAHGGLFLIFIYLLLITAIEYKWKLSFISMAFIASLLPFGTFYLETKLKAIDN
ncbi:MAG: integral membrane protein [Arcobacteraceae bacterium]